MTATIRRPDPADLADLAALTGFFDGLSTRTRVQRFFAPVRPTPAMVRLACGLARRTGHAGQDGHTGQDSQAAQAASSSGTPWPPTALPSRWTGR